MICDRCKHEENCPAKAEHGGAIRCSAFKPQEMSNEEWLKQCDTEQLATFLAIVQYDGTDLTLKKNHVEKWVEWLKEPYSGVEK